MGVHVCLFLSGGEAAELDVNVQQRAADAVSEMDKKSCTTQRRCCVSILA